MQGDPRVIELLNEVLTGELTAINQYFLHAKLCGHWGFDRLADYVRGESIDEMKHAEALIERILYLDGLPNLQRMSSITIGEDVAEQFALDLDLEAVALERLRRGVALCLEVGDSGSRDLLERILVSEEEHVDWLETQQEAIARIGIENYLSQQLHG
jgi:bacterioferritin